MFSTADLHPMIVHFPIALVIVGFVTDLVALFVKKELCFPKMSFYLLLLGTVAAFVAVLTGALFTMDFTGKIGHIKAIHATLAVTTLILLVITSVMRILLMKDKENRKLMVLSFIFYGLSTLSVAATGFMGGQLVYHYMM